MRDRKIRAEFAAMECVAIRMSDEFGAELGAFVKDCGYERHSEAIRDLAPLGLERARIDRGLGGDCLATLAYVFNHHTRELSRRLIETHHAHHHLQVATMHVHLDHDPCLEVAVLRGEASAVRDFSKTGIAERGVKYGQVNFVPISIDAEAHSHAKRGHARVHPHSHPKN
jgi:CopG family transcriptional regulator, nickel-responsive regulator